MSVVMERSRFVALAVTSTTGLVLATAGYFVISSPADAAGNQLLHMMGADTTAFRHGPPSCFIKVSGTILQGICMQDMINCESQQFVQLQELG